MGKKIKKEEKEMQMSSFFAERFGVTRFSRVVDDSLGYLLDLYKQGNQVVVMTAGTSAGKTSRAPQALALAYPDEHIWVSQPRRKAVRKNGGWVAREMGSRPGGLVGWRLAGDEPVESRQTRIHFRVDMSLVARIVADDGRLPEGFIIVDEAHERSIAIDMFLGLIKEGLPSSPRTKVLITSATIDTSAFSQFFDNAPVIDVPGTGFPIKDDEIIRLTRGEHHTQGAIRAANMVLDRFLAGEPMVPNETDTELVPVSKGTVLVLLPGKEDIEQAMRTIEWRAKQVEAAGNGKRVEVMECHGETQAASDDLIDQPMKDGVIRFVCATEVVRTSVTIAEIIGVVDSLQVKRPLADANGVVHLTKVAISKAEAEQGRGRGGRDRPAFYMPVSFGNEFENLAPHPTPAVVYSPLTSVVLQIASMGKSIRTFPMINRPEAGRIDVAIKRLERLDLLDAHERITEIGREVARFSVDPESAKGYWTAEKLGVLPEDVIASAVIENEGIFYTPKPEADLLADEWLMRLVISRCRKGYYKWELVSAEEAVDPATVDLTELPEWIVAPGQVEENDDEEEKEKKQNNSNFYLIKCGTRGFPFEEGARGVAKLVRRYFSPERSDFAAAVRMYRAARSGASKKIIGQFLNGRKIGLVDHTISLLKEDLAGSPLSLNGSIYREREFDGNALTKALASGHIDNVLVQIEGSRRSGYQGALGDFVSLGYSSICSTSNQVVLVGGVQKIDGRKGDFLLADMAAPVKPEWLVDVLPSLCLISDRDDHRYDFGQADRVIHTRDVKFGAVSMEMEVATTDKEQAARAFAKAAFSGGWLSEFSEANRHNMAVQERAEAIAVHSGGHTRRIEDKDIVSHYETVFYLNSVVSRASWKTAAEAENAQVSAADLLLSLENFVSKEKQEEVATGNPDFFLFLGKEREVRYEKGRDPVITLDHLTERAPESDIWKQIPDEGVCLPGGRRLSVVVYACGYNNFSGIDTRKVKDEVRRRINLTAWESFPDKPVISLPDAKSGDEVMPEVVEAQYGLDALTGEPAIKFGAVGVQTSFGSFNGFKVFWCDERGKAEETRAAAQKALDELAAKERERRELETVRAQSDKVKERLDTLYEERERSFKLPDDVRRALGDRRYIPRPSNAADLRAWIVETEAVIAKVEVALAEIAARNARRERYELATYEFNHTHAHLLVTESGLLFVGAWKGSKMGNVEIDPEPYDSPEVGERVAIDADGRYCLWRYIPSGEQVTVRDFAGSGTLNWEVTFCTPVSGMLTPGVWTIAEDDAGKFFYPSIHFRSGKEIIPEEVRIVRAKVRLRPVSSMPLEKYDEERSAGDGTFTDIGDRYFKCGCGATTRLQKGEWKQYQSGSPIDIECSTCGVAGSVARR